MIADYIHFPYCLRKCPYCDFNSYAQAANEIDHTRYADAVLRELTYRVEAWRLHQREVVSVFFGGGTPSFWAPEELGRVLDGVRRVLPLQADAEVTMECNPTSLDAARAKQFADVGITRFSLGVQSLDDAELKFLGRLHDGALAMVSLAGAQATGRRSSADLIFGLPNQPADTAALHAETIAKTGLTHMSCYALTIEDGTQFGELHRKGRLPIAVDDQVASGFLSLERVLQAHGFDHYEVSNYAKSGHVCAHNLHVWRGGDYLGLGAGAVGAVSGVEEVIAVRTRTERNPEKYMAWEMGQGAPNDFREELTREDKIREALMLGLRTKDGVDMHALSSKLGIDATTTRRAAMERQLARGNLTVDGGHWHIPSERWLGLDSIVADLF